MQPEELISSWTLLAVDRDLVANKTGATRLGFALLLKFFELQARFPTSAVEFAPETVAFVAEQVAVASEELGRYDWSGRTIKRHRAQIRAVFGFRGASEADEQRWSAWLQREVCPAELSEKRVREAMIGRCRSDQVEPPGETRIARVIAAARAAHDHDFTATVVNQLTVDAASRLELLTARPTLTPRGWARANGPGSRPHGPSTPGHWWVFLSLHSWT